ncbi:MAG: hypothetical protein DWQ01_00280 [Planctomycetota bacterium]|nr:MAG: hypothetical protein DWQ01_00280 [Planctomycetota bacterium]
MSEFLLLFLLGLGQVAPAQISAHGSDQEMPVREITVFKDGHAFLIREGQMPVDKDGVLQLQDLPQPVLGTFWARTTSGPPLRSVTASRFPVEEERRALTLQEYLRANVGNQVHLRLQDQREVHGRVLAFQRQPAEDPTKDLPVESSLLQLETSQGVHLIPLKSVKEVVFRNAPDSTYRKAGFESRLQMQLHGRKSPFPNQVGLRLAYLQKGLRWIPEYRMELDGNGKAKLRLQASLINDLIDLERVTLHLVIGVPRFEFADQLDPIALQEELVEAIRLAAPDARVSNMFSNAIMTQLPAYQGQSGSQGDREEASWKSGKNEDFYLFTVDHVSLAKGQRMVLPVVEFELSYRDLYTLDLPITPPREVRTRFNTDQLRNIAERLGQPQVFHKVRLHNNAAFPLTTAPVLIFNQDRILGQSLIRYAAPGAETDVVVTQAVQIHAKKVDRESQRRWVRLEFDDKEFLEVDLHGRIRLQNFGDREVEIEVSRHVLGHPDEVGQGGTVERIHWQEEEEYLGPGSRVFWWSWYGWPSWWGAVNGVGRFHWKLTLPAGEKTELEYAWGYYWR